MPPTHVLLDISPLTHRVEYRTGLARVALELYASLARLSHLRMQTCAWGSLQASRELRLLAADLPELNPVGVQVGWMERWHDRWRHGRPSPRGPSALTSRIGQVINLARNPLQGVVLSRFDVIHSTYARFPRVVRRSGVPTVVTVHDLIPLRLPLAAVGRSQRAITRRIIESIRPHELVACVSESTRADFLDYTRHPADRAVVIPNGIDHTTFKPVTDADVRQAVRKRFGLGDRPFVLTGSSLAAHKNLTVLIKAWQTLPQPRPGLLVIAGGLGASIEDLQRLLGIEPDDSVVVTGFVTDAELATLASCCNAFLFPSLHEGFGLPVLEAMAAGAPVVAADRTSLPELVGDAGTLLDPLDTDAWRSCMVAALSTPPRDRPHEPSLVRAASFSWDRTAKGYAALYRRAADRQ